MSSDAVRSERSPTKDCPGYQGVMSTNSGAARMRLYLVRHGITSWNLEGRYHSRTDVPLHDDARAALQHTAQVLQGSVISRCIVGGTIRSIDTARILQAAGCATGLELETCPELSEVDFGTFEGRTKTELRTGPDARQYAEWRRSDAGGPAAPGGEEWSSAAARASRFLAMVREDGRPTLAVAHS